MPSEVTVTTDPLIVYGMVGLLFGALVLALLFARPRRGLGAAKRPDELDGSETDAPDNPAPGHDPWSTGMRDETGPQPRWERR